MTVPVGIQLGDSTENKSMEPFIGQVALFAGPFAPQGWFFCAGQILPIGTYPALFSVIGTRFAGDGVRTFGLPDLRSKVPVGVAPEGGVWPNPGISRGYQKFATGNEVRHPGSLSLNYIIAFTGVYPPRNY